MDPEAQRRFARAVCAKNRSRRDYVAMKRRFLMSQVNQRKQKSPSETSSDEIPENTSFMGTPRTISGTKGAILDELVQLSRVPRNRRRFSVGVIVFAFSLYLLSSRAYEHLRLFLPLPSWRTLERRTEPSFKFNIDALQNLSLVHETVGRFRERENISDCIIYGILAVDAVSFQREMIITNNGVIEGGVSNETLDEEKVIQLQQSFSEFEEFWKSHHAALISDAFVYQFQPIDALLPSFVVHIKPSTQGKATESTVELLREIDAKLHSVNVECVGYAMDGDSTYAKMHRDFYDKYERRIRTNPFFDNYSCITENKLIVSDPLHLLKRARYRMLGTDTHLGLVESCDTIRVDTLRRVLTLPSKIFSEHKFTKMHDDLPVSLFSLSSLVELYERQSCYVAYFLPFCLLNAAIAEKDLLLEERVNFLEVSMYYMLAYVEEVETSETKLPDRKSSKSKSVRLFSSSLAKEFCNTAASLLGIIHRFNGTINLNRVGTNPLEHTFGLIRMRSRYKHTYQNMLKSLNATLMWKSLVKSLGVGSKVSGRRTYYGRTVTVEGKGYQNVLPFTPRDLAIAHHLVFGLPISSRELDSQNINDVVTESAEIVSAFAMNLASVYRRLYPNTKTIRLNSRSICVTAGQNLCMVKRKSDLE